MREIGRGNRCIGYWIFPLFNLLYSFSVLMRKRNNEQKRGETDRQTLGELFSVNALKGLFNTPQ